MNVLSSDVLEQQFGPTALDVLYGGEGKDDRVIQTWAVLSQTVLELSWVRFGDDGRDAFPDVHHHIIEGASMGRAFEEAGVEFSAKRSLVGCYRLPPLLNRYFGDANGQATLLMAHVTVGPDSIPYCDIREVYNPRVDCAEMIS